MTQTSRRISFLVLLFLGISCNRNPKESEPFSFKAPLTEISLEGLSNSLHQVVLVDVLPAEKYNYLKVQEDEKQFWIATRKMEVEKGDTYFYNESLLKTNFKSKEHNRVFDTLYLVTKLINQEDISAVHGKKGPQ